MEQSFRFDVQGVPATQGSKKFVTRHYAKDSCERLKPWRKQVALMARRACPWGAPIPKERVELGMVFVLPRPKAHYGTGRNAWILKPGAPKSPTTYPDLLKMARAVEDAMSDVIYGDDGQVCEYRELKKRYALVGEEPGVVVQVWVL